jgi:hypothetical protein
MLHLAPLLPSAAIWLDGPQHIGPNSTRRITIIETSSFIKTQSTYPCRYLYPPPNRPTRSITSSLCVALFHLRRIVFRTQLACHASSPSLIIMFHNLTSLDASSAGAYWGVAGIVEGWWHHNTDSARSSSCSSLTNLTITVLRTVTQ